MVNFDKKLGLGETPRVSCTSTFFLFASSCQISWNHKVFQILYMRSVSLLLPWWGQQWILNMFNTFHMTFSSYSKFLNCSAEAYIGRFFIFGIDLHNWIFTWHFPFSTGPCHTFGWGSWSSGQHCCLCGSQVSSYAFRGHLCFRSVRD